MANDQKEKRDLSNINDVSGLKDVVKMSVLEAFTEDSILEKLKKIMTPLLIPYKEALDTARAEISSLKTTVANHQASITKMSQEIEDLRVKNDDLKQHGRKDPIRIFGVPENKTGKTDDKLLSVITPDRKPTQSSR